MATDETLRTSIENSFVATGVQTSKKLGGLWYKSAWDLIADLLSLRPGDNVFFWLYQRKYTGVVGIFEVTGKFPFFHNCDIGGVSGKNYPFRVCIKPRKLYDYIALDDLLLADANYLPWVSALSAKKALGAFGGRGRSSTPLPPWGVEAVASALEEAGSMARWYGDDLKINFPKKTSGYPFDGSERQITVDTSIRLFPAQPPSYPGDIDLDFLPAVTPEGKFTVEKALEAWLMENVDRPLTRSVFLEDPRRILWFANYFPCSVSGVNIDAVVLYESSDGGVRLLVVELKKDSVELGIDKAVEQVVRYVNVATRLLLPPISRSYGADVKVEAAICGFASSTCLSRYTQKMVQRFEGIMRVPLRVVGYEIDAQSSTVHLKALHSGD
ncbi:MAG: hypothetical protein QXK98_04510 [Candidatus Bathyarchaeia archaeon]